MQPAMCTTFNKTIPVAQSIAMIQEAGFTVVSIGGIGSVYATPERRSQLQKLIEASGMAIDSVHAPFPEGDQLFSLDEGERLGSIRQCQTALDTAAELDGRVVAIHLIQPYGIPEGAVRNKMIEQGRRSVGALAAHAVARGVKLALENGQKREYDQVLEDLLAEFNDAHVGLCYDSGHENVQGTCFRLLETHGHRLLPVEADMTHSQFKDPAVFLTECRKRAERLLQRPGEDHSDEAPTRECRLRGNPRA